jgi:hypothetical protein
LPSVPLLPDIHPLIEKQYRPYDIGQVGQLDVHILTGIFGGDDAARDLTPAWDGGIYWAGQLRDATPAEQASTKSIGLLYLSAWKNASAAQEFVDLYVKELGRQYSGLKPDAAAQTNAPGGDDAEEQAFTTDEGPMVISKRGRLVFVSESFDLALARKLRVLIMNAQGSGDLKLASLHTAELPVAAHLERTSYVPARGGARSGTMQAKASSAGEDALTGSLVRFLSNCGVMRSAVDAASQAVAEPSNRQLLHQVLVH